MNINFEKYEVNEEDQSVTYSCASDLPYERYDERGKFPYDEVLVISEEAIDLSRLKGGASVLFNHDANQLLGVVDDAYIVESKLYVKVRFSRNDEFATRIFKDVIDGIVKNVSIGYQVLRYEDKKSSGRVTRYVTRWLPYETSIVSIPADDTVGIRSLTNNEECNTMEEEDKKEMEATPVEEKPQADSSAPEEKPEQDAKLEALQAECDALKKRVEELEKPEETPAEEPKNADEEEIKACGNALNVPEDEVKKAIESNMTARDFKCKYRNYNNIQPKEERKMNKFAEYLREGNFTDHFMYRNYPGFGGQTGEGGAPLIGTEKRPLVAALEKIMGLKGFRTITGLTSNISIPVQTTRNVAYQTEHVRDAATTSNPVFTDVTLSPVKIGGNTRIGKELLAQANDDVTAFIIDSLTKEIAYKLEDFMLGKVKAGAAGSVTYSALSAVDWQDILAFESAVGGYVLEQPAFVMSASARAALKGIEKATGTAQFLCSENNIINGYNCSVSGCVSTDDIYFGDFSKLLLGMWGEGMEIIVNPYTYAKEGDVEIVANILVDSAVLQGGAFCVGAVEDSNSN